MPRFLPLFAALIAGAALAAACSGGSSSRRAINITQADSGCTPTSVDLSPGEAVALVVKNDGSKDHEIEGINGTRVDEVLVPAGRTRTINYDAPSTAGTHEVKCYIPGGTTTILKLNVAGAGASPQSSGSATPASAASPANASANATVHVKLVSFTVTADATTVPAGPTRFIATNASPADTHELAVLRVKADGSYENKGEVEALAAGASGEVTLDLPPGKYLLSCLIAAGEAGSKVDHFQAGMHIPFEVR